MNVSQIATALSAGGVLLLTGCGGGGDSSLTASTSSSSSSTSSSSSSSGTSCGYTTDGATAAYVLASGSATLTDKSYIVSTENESAVCAENSGTDLTLSSPTIVTSGATTSTDDSSFYGLNAAVLAYDLATITVTGGTITTSGSGANGVFATGGSTGTGGTLNISNTTIKATGSNAHGLDAAMGGTLTVTDVTATTSGASGSVIATDRGGGTVTVTGGTYTASGTRSAGVYSTGTITVSDATLTAGNAEAVVVEGSNSVTLDGCTLNSTNANETRGIFLYNGESGDASAGTSYLTMTGGTYKYTTTTGPAIQITNTTAVIALTNVTISNSSSELLAAVVVSTWGTSGSNGGHVTLTASEQTLSGTVVVDSISSAALTLKNSSSLTGTINSADTAESVTLTLDSTSKWTVSGTSYLTKLAEVVLSSSTATNIVGSTSMPIVHAAAATDSSGNSLSGTYSLSGGGSLVVGS